MKFSYRKIPLTDRSAYFGSSFLRPIIPVTIQAGNKTIRYAALVDSGADFNIFHAEIGAGIGLDIPSGEPINFGGIHAKSGAQGYFHDVTLIVGGHVFPTRVAFSSGIAEYGHGVLGQKGFFEFFKVIFDHQSGSLEIKPKK
ncbi:MAG: hypothetical protein HY092_00100 [Candidatus Kerfeldbacteria bacterium]|nr:hypothetical protein [Candidatus Kerfeldbacteria bacterium]